MTENLAELFARRGIFTIGELLTRGQALQAIAPQFTNPVFVVTGDKDMCVVLTSNGCAYKLIMNPLVVLNAVATVSGRMMARTISWMPPSHSSQEHLFLTLTFPRIPGTVCMLTSVHLSRIV